MEENRDIITEENLIFLENSVKKLIDNGNVELARIMANNISKIFDDKIESFKIKCLKKEI
ncbi:MAG: hypothetical protein IKN63_00770 [Bacilli bacterium]|nr:hypothetical protein [Bacilli bacterium]